MRLDQVVFAPCRSMVLVIVKSWPSSFNPTYVLVVGVLGCSGDLYVDFVGAYET